MLPDPATISALATVSSGFGLLLILAYFYLVNQVKTTERSIRDIVEGEGLFNADQIVRILSTFTDDANRLSALVTIAELDREKARQLLGRVQKNINVTRLDQLSHQSRAKRSMISGLVFMGFGLLGLASSKPLPVAATSPELQCGFYRDEPLPSGEWEPYSPPIHGVETFWAACAIHVEEPITIRSVATSTGNQERFYKGKKRQVEVEECSIGADQDETVAVRIDISLAADALALFKAPSEFVLNLDNGASIGGQLPALPPPPERTSPAIDVAWDRRHGGLLYDLNVHLQSTGLKTEVVDQLLEPTMLARFRVLVIAPQGAPHTPFEDSEIRALQSWVAEGGELICADQAWSWASAGRSVDSFPLNVLGAAFGFRITGQSIGEPVTMAQPLNEFYGGLRRDGWWPSRVETTAPSVILIADAEGNAMLKALSYGKGTILVAGSGGLLQDNSNLVDFLIRYRAPRNDRDGA